MKNLNLPHQEPILFAKTIECVEDNVAIVKVEFEDIPSLAMLVESAAQSSAAFSDEKVKSGFLVSLKNIKLLNKIDTLKYDAKIILEHHLHPLTYFKFEIFKQTQIVATGNFVIAKEKKS